MAIGYSSEKERIKIEQVYRVDGYSRLLSPGQRVRRCAFGGDRGFSEEPIVRRVKVILHEDLHGDVNFAAVGDRRGDRYALRFAGGRGIFSLEKRGKKSAKCRESLGEERVMSQELNALIGAGGQNFCPETMSIRRKKKSWRCSTRFPRYQKQFERQIRGQHRATVLEAKLSHDLAYYRYFDAIVGLAEKASSLQRLIEDLKKMPGDATPALTEKFLQDLSLRYLSAAN